MVQMKQKSKPGTDRRKSYDGEMWKMTDEMIHDQVERMSASNFLRACHEYPSEYYDAKLEAKMLKAIDILLNAPLLMAG